jgi:hypothetical protein
MAQQNPWDDWIDGDRNTGIGNTGRGDPGPLVPAPPSFDLDAFYRSTLGRAPDANERATDAENIAKYGADAFQSDFLSKRPNNQPGSGTYAQAPARTNVPPLQFDDAYSNLLESIAQKQLGEVRSNPGLDSLMQFLTQQFQDLSTSPGYNTGEQAMLRTQALEPIEANRQASMQRARERSAARGFAPSSGLMELDLRDIERAADQARTVADRDLAIAGLDRRDRDLSRALDIGQLLGITIPKQQRGEELGLGNLLYQMPRTALQDALSVISGTPSSGDAFSQALQLLQQQYNQQGRADANNSALYGQIGQILAQLFR